MRKLWFPLNLKYFDRQFIELEIYKEPNKSCCASFNKIYKI